MDKMRGSGRPLACLQRTDRLIEGSVSTGRVSTGRLAASGMQASCRWAMLSLVCLALATAGCGIFTGGKPAAAGGGGGKAITLVLSAEAKLNTCGDGPANALGVRIYQLGGDRGISGAPQAALWENDEKELGQELLDKQELFLDPGSKQPVTLHLKPGVRAVAVIGNFCKSKGTCWKWVQPVEGMHSEIALRFGETCVEAAP